ncbi:hypothetical protein BD779DRAFT_1677274 [Infundibulicybe gibba]|nr:hypothetical protein BD779DRAFT_1677274 [Infundibulicybe gibba]
MSPLPHSSFPRLLIVRIWSVSGEIMLQSKPFRSSIAFALLVQVSNSVLVNQTIDDSLGDSQTGLKVQYSSLKSDSEVAWKSQDTPDDTCSFDVDSAMAHNHTWSSATCVDSGTASATFSFHGTAIYVYFIATSCLLPDRTTFTANCEFQMDGEIVGHYTQTSVPDIPKYNALVYTNRSLSDALHTFAIQAKRNSFLIFDFARYTTNVEVAISSGSASMLLEPTSDASTTSATNTSGITNTISISSGTNPTSTPTRSSTHTGIIAGSAVGGIVGIALIVLGVILCRNSRRSRVRPYVLAGTPAMLSIPPSKMSEHTNPFTSHEEARLEHRTSDPPQAIAMPHDQGDLSAQGLVSELTAQNKWESLGLKLDEWRRNAPLRRTAKPIPVAVGSPSSNVFE